MNIALLLLYDFVCHGHTYYCSLDLLSEIISYSYVRPRVHERERGYPTSLTVRVFEV